jgi:serine/threonine protein kinase
VADVPEVLVEGPSRWICRSRVSQCGHAGGVIEVGSVLEGRYEVVRLLARGGMANVFLARDQTLDREVAIKVVRAEHLGDGQRLEREARLLASFEHPHLVRVYVAGRTEHDRYVVLEYIDGPTLAQLIRQNRLTTPEVAEIGAQVADALSYIHERGVIHRDVKPSNVFVSGDGRTRLSDLGIARHDRDTHLTLTGTVIGTGAYMAPEQIEGKAVSSAADVYALGLVLVESLTGKPAYEGTAPEAAIARLARQPDIPPLPAAHRHDGTSTGAAAERRTGRRAVACATCQDDGGVAQCKDRGPRNRSPPAPGRFTSTATTSATAAHRRPRRGRRRRRATPVQPRH